MTPEAKVKKLVSTYLTDLKERLTKCQGSGLHFSMFVPTGWGKRNTLDYVLCLFGHHIEIETKAPDKDLTPNQRHTCRDVYWAGGTVFIISGAEGLEAFKRWVERNYADRLPKD